MNHVAQIPKCNVHTPAHVLDSILVSLRPRMIGLAMNLSETDYRNQLENMSIHCSAALSICNSMRWDISPFLRNVMGKSSLLMCLKTLQEDIQKDMENAIDELYKRCNLINTLRVYTWLDNESGAVIHHDSLYDCLLVEGEEIIISKKDCENKIVTIKIHNHNRKTTEFGGECHGLNHDDCYFLAYYEEDGERQFLKFEHDALFCRVNAPAGELVGAYNSKFRGIFE